jgi:hypothetical protein
MAQAKARHKDWKGRLVNIGLIFDPDGGWLQNITSSAH